MKTDDASGASPRSPSTPSASTPIELPIVPDVGLVVSAAGWQGDPEGKWANRLLPFTISGPGHILEFLETVAPGGDYSGRLAPPSKITIQGRRARIAGIPEEAKFYAFAYPLACLAGLYETVEPTDSWQYFLFLGGFCYFGADRQLLQTNAIVSSPSENKLNLIGPFEPSAAAIAALHQQKRLMELTAGALRAAGFERWAWINPGERPGDEALLADGNAPVPNNGTFVYEMSGGMSILYEVANLALFGYREDDTTRETVDLASAALAARSKSGSGRMLFDKAQTWRDKASVQRNKAFTYKPSTFGVLPEEPSGAPQKINPANYAHMSSYSPSTLGVQSTHTALAGVFNTMQADGRRRSLPPPSALPPPKPQLKAAASSPTVPPAATPPTTKKVDPAKTNATAPAASAPKANRSKPTPLLKQPAADGGASKPTERRSAGEKANNGGFLGTFLGLKPASAPAEAPAQAPAQPPAATPSPPSSPKLEAPAPPETPSPQLPSPPPRGLAPQPSYDWVVQGGGGSEYAVPADQAGLIKLVAELARLEKSTAEQISELRAENTALRERVVALETANRASPAMPSPTAPPAPPPAAAPTKSRWWGSTSSKPKRSVPAGSFDA